MTEAQNRQVVQGAYAAFGRGDIPGVLGALDDNILWKPVTGATKQVPISGERRGKPQVKEFFDLVAKHIHFSRFEPKEFIAEGDHVVTLGHYTAKTSSGG